MAWRTDGPAVLDNDHVRLAPVTEADREALRAIAFDPDIWRYFVFRVESDADFEAFFDASLADHRAGRRCVFVITDKRTGRVAGSMSYSNLSEPDARLEIGWSWLGRDFRGTGINRWAKVLLLEHAFERLGALRVEFKTDVLNTQARGGLRNIGAVEEGVLRSYNPMPDGRRRDAIYYSVLVEEWPIVKKTLAERPKACP
ncbi:GNAT family N-acetyltransferase [Frankia sp. CcI156]|uniref:GCN5-related N-acetyltransferase n=2 Tax=Frankia casuarinae (strain DSM 45818 / CECT 9043 / HFP020203 / CcI3) TaxID=106370 RepID=Q2J7W5_FRACC|nr:MULTISPECIES: GNAT family protein [Frankia]ABD12627.1 GCN5-related N-acetyltransferase [Frankia casuarinae]ETA03230.1 acetyltransferase, ribosomal protein N-acetylase [Frankia sp. CcI6]EYT91531.1 acetyltransferase, ribosomal protein N-acetylase [Frankia casuarinae]KDA41385.1 acetyltransferase, ribosomal protein N-acetylase [Frankia sp. BMG5.23]OHV50531.1 GCN5 family acetyltransferase [Frankia sp. CgIS1]